MTPLYSSYLLLCVCFYKYLFACTCVYYCLLMIFVGIYSHLISSSTPPVEDSPARPTSPLVKNGFPPSVPPSVPPSNSSSGSNTTPVQHRNPVGTQPVPRPRSTADSPATIKRQSMESTPTPRPRKGSAATKQVTELSESPPVLPPKPSGSGSLSTTTSSTSVSGHSSVYLWGRGHCGFYL